MSYTWITMRCHFAFLSIDKFVFITRYSLRYLSLKLYISSIKLLLLYKVYGICFRSEITSKANNCLHRWRPIFLWVKPFGCEKLNKKDFKTPNSCFDIFVFRFAKIWQITETYSPQSFSAKEVVAAPAIVIA